MDQSHSQKEPTMPQVAQSSPSGTARRSFNGKPGPRREKKPAEIVKTWAFDSIGNSLGDVTSETTFTMAPDGSCTANTCNATVAGSHTVTGTDGSFTDDASMTVSPEALDHMVLSPADATIASGGSQTYTVEGFDVYGNSRGDITFGTTTYSITPDGSCTSNVCTATVSGSHTVKATRGAKNATAILHVSAGATASIVISPDTASTLAGAGVTYTAQAFDSIGGRLKSLASPNEAVFYTSGRTSNEAAFLLEDGTANDPYPTCGRATASSRCGDIRTSLYRKPQHSVTAIGLFKCSKYRCNSIHHFV
jgi:hypothetical protein